MKHFDKYKTGRETGWLQVVFMLLATGCITPFEPDLQKYEKLLVVDGAISNIPGSVYVKLSRTSPYNDRNENPVNNATVMLIDDMNNRLQLVNSSPGKYVLSDSGFAGQIGRSYKIHVETEDGLLAESDFEEIKEPVLLDQVKFAFVEGNNNKMNGLEIQLDVENKNHLDEFFYWEFKETWKFEVPYSNPFALNTKICYKTSKPPLFLTFDTRNRVQKQLVNYPLYSIDNASNRLHIRYSVEVIQHVLSEETFDYYQNLKEVNENRGSLFDNSPVTLIGNMRSLSDQDQPVLGNFQVSGAVTKRLFIDNDEIADKLETPSGFENCQIEYAGKRTDAALLDSLSRKGWYIMERSYNPAVDDTIMTLVNFKGCCDCRTSGTNIIPDFWEEK